jgi:predicted AAA+ superfamily ATPase
MRREKMIDVLEHPMREGAPPYIPRELNAKFPATGKCVTIVGPRRAGKTYYLYQKMDELRQTAPDEGLLYVNFEDERLIGLRLEDMDALLRTFRELHPGSSGRRLNAFLDEVQAVTGWERFVRRLIDTEDIRIHITGSSSKLLSTEIGTSMRGRSITYTMLPFSFREYLAAKGVRPTLWAGCSRRCSSATSSRGTR